MLSSFTFTSAFADSFVVDFDKQQYFVGDSLLVSGEILDLGMPIIAMSIYDPNGKILSANNLEISSENTFSKTISLDSPFYDKTGQYKIKFDYGQISENHYFSINGASEPEIVDDFSEPELLLLYTEKMHYSDKDTIQITGLVSSLDSPTVLIGIYDPFGIPAGFYFGDINSDLAFTTSFLVKDGVNFRLDGTYFIKAHYADSEAISFFEYSKVAPTLIQTIEEPIQTIEDKTENEFVDEVSSNEIIHDVVPVSPEEIINEPTTNVSQNDSTSSSTLIIQTDLEDDQKINNSETKKTIQQETENKEQNNLSVENIELGKLLNQVNLECDSSELTDMISYYDGMGPALYRLCKFDSSLNFFNESLIKNPTDIEVLVSKGSAVGKLGNFSEALVYYEQALSVDPYFIPAKNNKANVLVNMGNIDDAILLYNEILEVNPDSTTTRKNLQTALSMIPNFQNESEIILESDIENIIYSEPSFLENDNSIINEKQKTTNFFDELNIAFSSLSSLFGFLN